LTRAVSWHGVQTAAELRRRHRRLDRKLRRGAELRERVEIALNILHEGHVLHFHFDRRWGPSWVLSPGNWPVPDEVARALIAEPDVVACGDGLFADTGGPSQTYLYRFIEGETHD
jgi:hypothetical protein